MKSFDVIINNEQKMSLKPNVSLEPPNIYGGKAISYKCFEFSTKGGNSFRKFNCIRELI